MAEHTRKVEAPTTSTAKSSDTLKPTRPNPVTPSARGLTEQVFRRAMGDVPIEAGERDDGVVARAYALGVQPQLAISQPGDPDELEADRVADQVLRMPGSQSGTTACSSCEEEKVQRKPAPGAGQESGACTLGLRGAGHPLAPPVRSFFEPRFGADLANVRVHTDDSAGRAADSIGARAFTLGSDIAFARNQFAPETTEGRRLLAHELSHVMQQSGAHTPSHLVRDVGDVESTEIHGNETRDTTTAMLDGSCLEYAVQRDAVSGAPVTGAIVQRQDTTPPTSQTGATGGPGAAAAPGATTVQKRHYRLEAKAWIPQFHVVDPEAPLGITAILGVSPRALEKRMLDSMPPNSQPTGYESHYRGDSHSGYDGAYRVLQAIELDWDGEKIQNVTVPSVAHIGASHRDVRIHYFDLRALASRDVEDSETATATGAVTHESTDREVHIGIHSANPLTVVPSPDIDADISLFLSSDPTFGTEEVTVRWTTDLMPSHGFQLIRDGAEVATQVTNDISGMTPTGPGAAAEIFIRLNSKANAGARSFSFIGSNIVAMSNDHATPSRPAAASTDRRDPPPNTAQDTSAASMVALQRSAGDGAVGQLVAAKSSDRPVVQRGILDAIGDALDIRYNEKERDEYEDSISELEKLKGGKPITRERHQPSTGAGMFDVAWSPANGQLTMTVRCHFNFHDSVVERKVDPKSDPSAPTMIDIVAKWDPAEIATWKAQFIQQATSIWKDTHTFYCQRDWWEGLTATTQVQIVDEPDTNPFKYHYLVTVHKRGSLEKGPAETVGVVKKQAEFGQEMFDDPKGKPLAAHEAGHMLGLGDEYTGPSAGPLLHDKLAKLQLGKEIVQGKGDPESLMNDGAKVLPEHGVTFFEALETLRPDLKWGREPKPRRPVPATRPNYPVFGPFW